MAIFHFSHLLFVKEYDQAPSSIFLFSAFLDFFLLFFSYLPLMATFIIVKDPMWIYLTSVSTNQEENY